MKLYVRKLSPSALKTFGEIISKANVTALIDNDRDKIDDIGEIYSLYVSANCGNPESTEWEDW